MTSDNESAARAVLAAWDAEPRHGEDDKNCGVCYGSCGAWPGEIAGDTEEHARALAEALRTILSTILRGV